MRRGKEVAEPRATGCGEMRRDRGQCHWSSHDDSAGHAETDTGAEPSGRGQERRDAMGKRYVVIVEEDDELAPRGCQPEIARAKRRQRLVHMERAHPIPDRNARRRYAAVYRRSREAVVSSM